MRWMLIGALAVGGLVGCQSTYYSAMEQVGYHKRDIMVTRVEDAKESQQEAQEEFTSALEAVSALSGFDGGDLEKVYNDINDKYEDSEKAAEEVRDRISEVEDVSEALFEEWQAELEQYTSAKLRRSSEQKMTPVLNTLRDNTLYLKHNLNASAIGSLQGELISLENDIQLAINQMNAAIEESDKFIGKLNNQ